MSCPILVHFQLVLSWHLWCCPVLTMVGCPAVPPVFKIMISYLNELFSSLMVKWISSYEHRITQCLSTSKLLYQTNLCFFMSTLKLCLVLWNEQEPVGIRVKSKEWEATFPFLCLGNDIEKYHGKRLLIPFRCLVQLTIWWNGKKLFSVFLKYS